METYLGTLVLLAWASMDKSGIDWTFPGLYQLGMIRRYTP